MIPPIYVLSAAFLFGIVAGLQYEASLPAALFVGLVGLATAGILFLRGKHRIGIMCIVSASLVICGIARVQALPMVHEQTLESLVGSKVVLEGVVITEPDARETSTLVTIRSTRVFYQTNEQPVSSVVLVRTLPYARAVYGDTVRAEGFLHHPASFDSGNGREFDYPGYLEVRHIGYQLDRASISVEAPAGQSLLGVLISIKQWFVRGIHRALPEPEGGLAAGITVGDKRSLGEDLTEAFRTSGLIHVVVLSGYHITVVGAVLLTLLSFLPRTAKLLGSFFGIVLFVLMTGSSSTALRAGAMGGIALLAQGTHLMYDALRALMVAVVGMTLWQPLVLLYDPGFQMSVAATFGIIVLTPKIAARLTKLPKLLSELLSTTLGAQFLVAPLIAYYMGSVSLIAFVANILVLPIVPLAMLLSVVAGVIGAISPISVATLFGFPALLTLWYMVHAALLASSVPFASISIPPLTGWVVVGVYAVAGFLLIQKRAGV